MLAVLSYVCCSGESGKHLLAVSISPFDPGRVETFFVPQKLHATGRDGPRRDRLSLFLLYRVWSQCGRNLKPGGGEDPNDRSPIRN
jgi:hypothetical protein